MIENQTVEVTAKRGPRWTLPLVALGIGVLLLGVGVGVLAGRYDRYAYPGAATSSCSRVRSRRVSCGS